MHCMRDNSQPCKLKVSNQAWSMYNTIDSAITFEAWLPLLLQHFTSQACLSRLCTEPCEYFDHEVISGTMDPHGKKKQRERNMTTYWTWTLSFQNFLPNQFLGLACRGHTDRDMWCGRIVVWYLTSALVLTETHDVIGIQLGSNVKTASTISHYAPGIQKENIFWLITPALAGPVLCELFTNAQ